MKNLTTPPAPTALEVFEEKAKALVTDASKTEAAAISTREVADGDNPVQYVEITPAVAAALFLTSNVGGNRDFSLSKAQFYANAMKAGEWKHTHQGIAFYVDGKLADGQHRLGAIILSGMPVHMIVMNGFGKDAFDAIDVGKARNSGDAAQLMGIENGKQKASIASSVLSYNLEVEAGKVVPTTVHRQAKFTEEHNDDLQYALDTAKMLNQQIADPALGVTECATILALMLIGGWEEEQATAYVSSIQTGVATKEGSPSFLLSQKFSKAKSAASKKGNLTKKQKLALAMKGAPLFAKGMVANKIDYHPSKEPLPTAHPPMDLAAE